MGGNGTEPLIFPMAHYVGELYDVDSDTSTFELRGGWREMSLTASERDVWIVAHGLPDQLREGTRWTKSALVEAARPVAGDEVEATVAGMLERDILMEATPGTKQAVEFAKEIRLVPLQMGGGNSRDEPWMWRIGMPQEIVRVSHTVYEAWEWSHLYENLWESCKALAKINAENPDIPAGSEKRDSKAILTAVLETTHILLATSCVYLDVPFEWGKA